MAVRDLSGVTFIERTSLEKKLHSDSDCRSGEICELYLGGKRQIIITGERKVWALHTQYKVAQCESTEGVRRGGEGRGGGVAQGRM